MSCKGNISEHHVDFFSGNLQPVNPMGPIIHIIRESMQAEKIFHLGTYQAWPQAFGLEYDLLVLIRPDDKKPMHEFESLIVNRCHDFAMVTASVHKMDTVNQLLKNGNIFFSELCDPNKLLFDGAQMNLEKADSRNLALNYDGLNNEFSSLFSKAKAFLSGAFSYSITGDQQLAAFMLHQTVEHCLNAFLTSLIGYRLQTHNLNKLFLYARRFSVEFYTIFPRNSDKEIQLYQTLHKAYIYGRYKNNFLVGTETLQMLIERANTLLEMTELIFREKLEKLQSGINNII